jgi:hypothetical protein
MAEEFNAPAQSASSGSGTRSSPELGPRLVRTTTNLRASKSKMSPMVVRVALSEFRRWCIDTFHDLEIAWDSFNPAGADSMTQEEFVKKLKAKGYPQADLGCKQVFDCMQTNKVITEESFYEGLDSVSVGRTAKHESERSKPAIEVDMDPEESLYTGHASGGSALQMNR